VCTTAQTQNGITSTMRLQGVGQLLGYPAETGTNPSSLPINPQLNYRSNY